MRRWNPLSLVALLVVALLVVALLATALMTPRGALAAPSSSKGLPSSSTNFKGKVVAKDRTDHYFVFSFTCSNSTLSGKWTYEVSSTQSFTGTTTGTPAAPAPACELTNGSYSTASIPLYFNGMPVTTSAGPQAMLTLSLTNIVASKTFFGTFVDSTTGDCVSTNPPCVAVQTSDDMLVIPTTPPTPPMEGFSLVAGSFSTLNLSAR